MTRFRALVLKHLWRSAAPGWQRTCGSRGASGKLQRESGARAAEHDVQGRLRITMDLRPGLGAQADRIGTGCHPNAPRQHCALDKTMLTARRLETGMNRMLA